MVDFRNRPFDLPIGGDVTLAFCGTCWSNTAQALGGGVVYLDRQNIDDAPFFFNAASQQATLPTLFVPINGVRDGTRSRCSR